MGEILGESLGESLVRVTTQEGIQRWVLNRPARRNALDHGLIEALLALFAAAGQDPAVRVVVLAGAGPGFCAGADLDEAKTLRDEPAIARHADLMARLLLAPWLCQKPVLAEVHGFALGAGLGLALGCDGVFCAEDARLGFPETRHGMVPALVAPMLLRRVGHAVAFEILATGRPLPVERAASLGLVHPCPPDAVTARAAAFAADLAGVSADVTGALKALLKTAGDLAPEPAMAAARRANVAGKLRGLREDA